jgi:hypothetical protein
MTIIQLKNRFYTIPTAWNELSGKQLIRVAEVLLQRPEEITGKMMLLKILTGMSSLRWITQRVEELEDELYLTEFLLSDASLTEQLLPVFPNSKFQIPNSKLLYGPSSSFDNMRIGEFSFCEYYYNQYEKKGAENGINELNQLVGTLYRRHKPQYNGKTNPDGDVREKFNKNLCDVHYPAQVAHWPLAVKVAIGWWFKANRVALQNQFKEPFSGGGDIAKYGLWSVMNAVAEKGNHGDFLKVEDMLLKEFMMELSESIEKNKKLEAKAKAGS